MNSSARSVIIACAVAALAAAPAVATPSFTVVEGGSPGVTAGGVTTWFTGMYSDGGNPRGHVMGVESADGPSTLTMAFSSDARIVARAPGAGTVIASGWYRRTILGGTGAYLGAKGTVRTKRVRGVYTHEVTYALPRRGTPRTYMAYSVRLGKPVIADRGGARGIGNGRVITGTLHDAAGATVGSYLVDSTLVFVYGAGTYEWYSGAFAYTLADGTLRAEGPYQRASAAAPGALAPSGRVVTGGTGAYSGMRGQVVVTPNTDGTATHSFTLLRPAG